MEKLPINIFQTKLFKDFGIQVNNLAIYNFTSHDRNGKEKGWLQALRIKENGGIKGFFSSRALIFGGPIINSKIKQERIKILDDLLKQLVDKLASKTIFIQFRNFSKWSEDEKKVFAKHGFNYRERQNVIIDLKSERHVLRNMSESKRRQIRLAKKNGTITRAPNSLSEIKEFYKILKELYKNQIRKPLPDFSFFEQFYIYTFKGLGIIRLILVNDKIIGGVVAPVTPNETIYYWYVAGLDHQYKNNYPSVMAVWSLIEYGLENNIKELDFMGIGKPNQNYGVREFKLRFSNNIVDYGRFGRRNNKFLYSIAETGYNFLRLFRKV